MSCVVAQINDDGGRGGRFDTLLKHFKFRAITRTMSSYPPAAKTNKTKAKRTYEATHWEEEAIISVMPDVYTSSMYYYVTVN